MARRKNQVQASVSGRERAHTKAIQRDAGQIGNPDSRRSDLAHAIARGAISSIPLIGGAIAVLFEEILPRPVELRRDNWVKSLSEAVSGLQRSASGADPESLSENQNFVSAVLQASQIAQRTHSHEKLAALRHAVENSGHADAPADYLQQIFLHLVDEFTPWHLQVLALLHDTSEWLENHERAEPEWSEGDWVLLTEFAFPPIRGENNVARLIILQLQQRGLIEGEDPYETYALDDLLNRSPLTPLGIEFLKFISPRYRRKRMLTTDDISGGWDDPTQYWMFPEDSPEYEDELEPNLFFDDMLLVYSPIETIQAYVELRESASERCGCDICSLFTQIRSRMPSDFLWLLTACGIDPSKEAQLSVNSDHIGIVFKPRYYLAGHFLTACEPNEFCSQIDSELQWSFLEVEEAFCPNFPASPLVCIEVMISLPWEIMNESSAGSKFDIWHIFPTDSKSTIRGAREQLLRGLHRVSVCG